MKKTIVLVAAISVAIFSMSFDVNYGTGIAGSTSSPSESNCSGCHAGNAVNTAGGSLLIEAPTLTNGTYTPGQTYEIKVTVAKTGASLFGFGFEALTSGNVDAGTLAAKGNTKIMTGNNKRTNVVHTGAGAATANTFTFTFNWTAPATNVGTVTFYAAGNAANKDGGKNGDFIYTKTMTVSSTVGVAEQLAASLNISVYPNPTTDFMYIKNTTNSTEKMKVTIVDITGRIMLTEENVISNGVINVSALSKGNYFAKIEKSSGTAVKRFVKD